MLRLEFPDVDDATDAHRDNVVDPCNVVVNGNNDISGMDEDENASDVGDTNIDTLNPP